MNWYDSGKLMAMAAYADKDMNYKDFNTSLFEINMSDIRDVKLKGEYNTFQEKANFCAWLQDYTQNYVIRLIVQAIEMTGCKNVCLSGGYFLNCVANSYIRKNISDEIKIFVEPICGDDGVSIGLAKLHWHEQTLSKKITPLKNVYNGVKREIDVEGKKTNFKEVAQLLAE